MTHSICSLANVQNDILFYYSPKSCFQTDDLLIGYINISVKSTDLSELQEEEIKNSVHDSPENVGELHFCGINFNTRKFALLNLSTDVSEEEQFAFTDLEKV